MIKLFSDKISQTKNKWQKQLHLGTEKDRTGPKRAIILMQLSFWGVWTLYLIVLMLQLIGINVPHSVTLTAHIVAKFGVIANPIVFVFNNKEISRVFLYAF